MREGGALLQVESRGRSYRDSIVSSRRRVLAQARRAARGEAAKKTTQVWRTG
uniref:Uncharacterized protein n=1 Tax=Oryza glaberrima TaxID=4538 RepID=I1QRN3_ORYGL